MSDDSSDSDDEGTSSFPRVEPTIAICLGVDTKFCKLTFEIKHTIYNTIMYEGDANTQKAQDPNLNNEYQSKIGILYNSFIDVFNSEEPPQDIPEEIIQEFPDTMRDKLKELYSLCYQQRSNTDIHQVEHYKLFIKNMFNIYIYDMGTR